MAPIFLPGDTIAPKYSQFIVTDTPYKEIRGQPILASIFVPQDLTAASVPVAIHWHGGGLVTGHRLFPDWHADWTLELALRHNAIVVSPDYRLLPEAKGIDLLEDLRDFYAWLLKPGNLQNLLLEGVIPDLDHLLVTGESAGGWFAIQSGFAFPNKVSSIIAQYAMIDLKSAHFVQDYHKDMFDPPAPQLDRSILQNHLDHLTGQEIVSARTPPDGVPLLLVAFQSGRFGALFGQQTELYPLEQLERATTFPRLWLVHGDKDNVVPVEGTEAFTRAFTERFPTLPLHVSILPGENHGFDNHAAQTGLPATLDTDWVALGVSFIGESWPTRG